MKLIRILTVSALLTALISSSEGLCQTPVGQLRQQTARLSSGHVPAGVFNPRRPTQAPGYTLVLTRDYAHYVAENGPQHFCITRAEYNRRREQESRIRDAEYAAESIRYNTESILRDIRRIGGR